MVHPSHFALTAVIAVGTASFSLGAPLALPPPHSHPDTVLPFNDPLGRALQPPTGALNMMTRELDTRKLGAVIIEDEPMPHLFPHEDDEEYPFDKEHPFEQTHNKVHNIQSISVSIPRHNEDSNELGRREEKETAASVFDPYHELIAHCKNTANSNEEVAAQCDAIGLKEEAQTLRDNASASRQSAAELQQKLDQTKVTYSKKIAR
ncbi:hypothetical protein GGU10DRAFT_388442 [Lentinula aff. detonsa]|uniref:Uncharacterized protein n=1 Tax=Lentinula aff. detonsa TaxID=2804958 RepID=A0AA38NPD1_9AGAR|nr:hypothetical protein GGU10DRAFT_388442 [Lentinula aff. detonsa]